MEVRCGHQLFLCGSFCLKTTTAEKQVCQRRGAASDDRTGRPPLRWYSGLRHPLQRRRNPGWPDARPPWICGPKASLRDEAAPATLAGLTAAPAARLCRACECGVCSHGTATATAQWLWNFLGCAWRRPQRSGCGISLGWTTPRLQQSLANASLRDRRQRPTVAGTTSARADLDWGKYKPSKVCINCFTGRANSDGRGGIGCSARCRRTAA